MPLIIPLFILQQGCPQRCAYCNEAKAVGDYPSSLKPAFFRETVEAGLRLNRRKKGPVQIAFYGGNFTGLKESYQEELLAMAGSFIRQGLVESVRISTRPDQLDEKNLDFLQRHAVKTVEIGAQSLVDEVLSLARRGHTAGDVRRAVGLLKERGLETGLHLMVGLPGDDWVGFAFTVEETLALRPDMVRLHPTLVFSGTELAESYARGTYRPLTLAEAVLACKDALGKFSAAGIPVIRLGLQTTPAMENRGSVLAGPFHPAFRALVEAALFFDRAAELLSPWDARGKEVTFFLSPRDVSYFRGQKNQNLQALQEQFGLKKIVLSLDPARPRGFLAVALEGQQGRLPGHDLCRA